MTLYDINLGSATQKMVMQTRPNALAWNPMEPFHFTLASEDHCLYTFDMRKVAPRCVGVGVGGVGMGGRIVQLCVRQRCSCMRPCVWLHTAGTLLTLASQLKHAICVHRDHVSAVLAVDYSPTGQQFVSGSYDKTIRIWDVGENKSGIVYHTKRMCVAPVVATQHIVRMSRNLVGWEQATVAWER